jgi:hypothetical protein
VEKSSPNMWATLEIFKKMPRVKCHSKGEKSPNLVAQMKSSVVPCAFLKWNSSRLWPGLPDFSWYMIPKREKCTKLTQNVPNGNKIYQNDRKIFHMTIHYIKIWQPKDLQNLPKLGFLVWKQTIRQPWLWPDNYGGKNTFRNQGLFPIYV